jgi:hypothetical protein
MEKKEKTLFSKEMDRRSFLRKSEKIAILAAIAMARTNPIYSLLAPGKTSIPAVGKGNRLMIPSVWWRMLSTTEDGQLSYWDTAKLHSLKANWVSASYRPMDAQNHFVGTSWVIPPKMIEKVMELARPGLRSAHKAGIQVVGTTDSMQFNPEVMKSVGIDPELLYGRSLAGKTVGFDTYQKGNHMSCLMNPHWQDIETSIAKAHAEAGFDGLFLDLFPYVVREGVLCGCDHCKKGWEAYSEKTFGKKQSFPRAALQLKDTVDRTFFAWRIETIHHFMERMQDAGKKFNADFKVLLNCNADNPCMAYLLLMGMLQPTSELGQLNAGNESSLYLYRMIESASQDQLFSQFNGSKQYLPDYKYKTALAEAYAAGGALMLAVKNEAMDAINKRFTDFLLNNRAAFEGCVSDASAAILYSWRDHTFLQADAIVRTDRMIWRRNSARRAAAVLASKGIPFDYLFVEKGISTDDLLKYDVIIAPELKLLDDKDADAIKGFVDKGGKLLALGSFGTMGSNGLEYVARNINPLASWVSYNAENDYLQAVAGRGKVCAVKSYQTGDSEAHQVITPAFNKAVAFLDLDSQLRIQNKGNGRIESSIRKNGKNRFIHLIRYACEGKAGATGVSVVYRIPGNYKIQSVTAVSPFTGNDKETIDWKVKAGHIAIETKVAIYTMIRVELT